jgi:hypothetical protein
MGVKAGLRMNGYLEGVHYSIGHRPPAALNVPEAYRTPESYKRCITFHDTGFTVMVVSPQADAAGVGTNVDVVFSDETYLVGWQWLQNIVFPANRGSGVTKLEKALLARSPYFGKFLFHSSTALTAEGQQVLLNLEDPAIIAEFKNIKGAKVVRANWTVNRGNLKENYGESLRPLYNGDTVRYDAQVGNIRPSFAVGGFYAGLDMARHRFGGVCPYDRTQPLYIGMDFGVAINCIRAFQLYGNILTQISEHKVLSGSGIHTHCAAAFAKHYPTHRSSVEFFYDNTGNNPQINATTTFADDVVATLRRLGLRVNKRTSGGTNPFHHLKHLLWTKVLAEDDDRFPRYRHHASCVDSWRSMQDAKGKRNANGKYEKDKGSERSVKVKPEHATHYSDAGDFVLFGLYWRLIRLLKGSEGITGSGYNTKLLDRAERALQKNGTAGELRTIHKKPI